MSDYLISSLAIVICTSLVLAYSGWQARNFFRWRRAIKQRTDPADASRQPSITIVVPFRNEAENLPVLWQSLLAQDYPRAHWEVIFIDDHSTDGGADFLGADAGCEASLLKEQGGEVRHRILQLADHLRGREVVAHKKAALAWAIGQSAADIILTTDADCLLPPDLLSRLALAFTPETDVVLGPVFISREAGFCAGFQALDLAGYQLYTAAMVAAGAPGLANGACLAFRRERFGAAGGYAGVDHLPSGDDVLLLHKFKRAGYRAAWLPGTRPVETRPVAGWRALWRQRLRWAGKAGSYVHPGLQFGQALTYLTSLGLVLALFTFPLHLRPRPLLLLWCVKMLVDYLLLRSVAMHYGRREMLGWYLPTALLYPFYLVAVGTAALLGVKTSWKGRAARRT